ncbi:methylation protein EvaC [Streptomyces sp. DSM 42143]|uniref:class I SAM-dependent methyltransferase n=1 Tax=Streptomyces TaxID=1883 RepID=UPI000BCB10F9|nr:MULTISPECIES: class I SAM-dependent methyltransferase [unclassified Streptomyces]MDN3246985.1 class I SAM-dependent methyltransferase [Streptomyces sp. ZSW22]MDN3254758.1 class I SAM-dependent methyltransferase [Streptomyces sp. MA25(2023)]MDQ0386412.1 methylation protein EvaC [Streptomyces sp. DSM 42143]PAK25581.1 SAM-dependent methyltransferase [Streptomyces sp. alain-838]
MSDCRVCAGPLTEFLDLGTQPNSDAFPRPDETDGEFFFRLAVGRCASCTMVQLMEEVPRERMFHRDYPYHSSGSSVMREHFENTARLLLATEATGPDPFVVEIGCNDGVMLATVGAAGVRHLGVDPSQGVADEARAKGVRVRTAFFEESTALGIAADDGRADVVYAANTLCHIPYLDSVFRGLDALLKPDGVFVFEDPYLGEIVERTSFDQIYDEHFYFFTARSVRNLARRHGFELVDVARLPVHGGEVRYTLARRGTRVPTPAVAELLAEEESRALADPATLERFAADVRRTREELVALLTELRGQGRRVVAYGATAKSATVANYCGIGPDLVSAVYDTTPAKQGRLTPGSHIPVHPSEAFGDPYPDYALLFAWNHAEEIMAKEREFRAGGGRWILYTPAVHVL